MHPQSIASADNIKAMEPAFKPSAPTVDQGLLDEIVRRILTVSQPERIVLFGSAATGQMTRDSDIDLLIVEPFPDDTRKRSLAIRTALGNVGFPFDIIVMSVARFHETKDVIGGIAYPANKYGRVIHVKPQWEIIMELVAQWLAKAESDLVAATYLAAAETSIWGIAGFHAQQAAEKYIKAFLTEHQIEFPKSHEIDKLLNLVRIVDAPLAESLIDAHKLTPYGVEIQYPGDRPELDAAEAEEALKLAMMVRDRIMEELPTYANAPR